MLKFVFGPSTLISRIIPDIQCSLNERLNIVLISGVIRFIGCH